MNASAAIQASYADFRLVKSRKVVQLVFEVPLEKANEAIGVLGGMPDPAAEVWVAVARLQSETKHTEKPKRTFDQMSYAEQAGMTCQDGRFKAFLRERHGVTYDPAEYVRKFCDVSSRADIRPNTSAAGQWRALVSQYHTWLQATTLGVA